ncbi:MAG: hypothetical protein NZ899_03245 [Thermoguttaceae bacterium]|nr:hypothetical protein [Thermoguttaceae bacterium]MDW8078869.1 hypothetical protein [Thermoguttaceae bacterium]
MTAAFDLDRLPIAQAPSNDRAVAPAQEAARLFRAIFGHNPPDAFTKWFVSTPTSVFPPFSEEMWRNYFWVLTRVKDLEALEFASRLFGRNQVLTYKLRLAIYLAECCPGFRRWFVNRADLPFLVALAKLGLAKLYTLWKLLKGLVLLLRYHGP